MAEEVRVRIAPSPTGKFHLGTARTALFNYLFAKKFDGKFIVRVEDTDMARHDPGSLKDILEGLLWMGLSWDEGPEVGGDYGPYFQHERIGIYDQLTQELLEKKLAYRCYCTAEELEVERQAQQAKGLAPKYSGRCRHLSAQEIIDFEKADRPSVVRFAVEKDHVAFDDLIRGKVEFDARLFGDFIIVRSDGMPLFVFTNVIDDNLMKISHVLRGEEHLVNTAKQVLLATALDYLSPQFGHFPLILNADRSKMSKRKNPVSVTDDYKAKGYLPDALTNFIALLGWSSGTDREIFSLPELIEEFELDHVGKSPSIFDSEKLLWMNGLYIRQKPLGDVASEAQGFITNKTLFDKTLADPSYYLSVVALVQDRLRIYSEIEKLIEYFFITPDYPAELLVAKKSTLERTLPALKSAEQIITDLEVLSTDATEKALRAAAQDLGINDGELLWAVRVALSGRSASPGTFELLKVMPKTEILARIATAIKKLES